LVMRCSTWEKFIASFWVSFKDLASSLWKKHFCYNDNLIIKFIHYYEKKKRRGDVQECRDSNGTIEVSMQFNLWHWETPILFHFSLFLSEYGIICCVETWDTSLIYRKKDSKERKKERWCVFWYACSCIWVRKFHAKLQLQHDLLVPNPNYFLSNKSNSYYYLRNDSKIFKKLFLSCLHIVLSLDFSLYCFWPIIFFCDDQSLKPKPLCIVFTNWVKLTKTMTDKIILIVTSQIKFHFLVNKSNCNYFKDMLTSKLFDPKKKC